MKKLFCIVFIMIITVGMFAGCSGNILSFGQNVDYDKDKISVETVEGNSRFAFDIFQQLDREDGKENIFISPLSISTALAMTYQGAGTTTKEAMANTLGYTDIEDEKLNESYQNLILYLRQMDSELSQGTVL